MATGDGKTLLTGVTEGTRTPDLQGHNLRQFTGDGRVRPATMAMACLVAELGVVLGLARSTAPTRA